MLNMSRGMCPRLSVLHVDALLHRIGVLACLRAGAWCVCIVSSVCVGGSCCFPICRADSAFVEVCGKVLKDGAIDLFVARDFGDEFGECFIALLYFFLSTAGWHFRPPRWQSHWAACTTATAMPACTPEALLKLCPRPWLFCGCRKPTVPHTQSRARVCVCVCFGLPHATP